MSKLDLSTIWQDKNCMVQIFKIFSYFGDNEHATMRIVNFFLSLNFSWYYNGINQSWEYLCSLPPTHSHIIPSLAYCYLQGRYEVFIENLNDKSEQKKVDLQSGRSAFKSSFFHLLCNSDGAFVY